MRSILVVFVLLVAACGDDGGSAEPPDDTGDGPSTTEVDVFFIDEAAFSVGTEPYEVAVSRDVDADAPEAGALEALFAGPSGEEADEGLVFVASEATGFTDLSIEDGVASVTLVGGCSSGGSTLTIADQIGPTLRQFAEVEAVKIFDPSGETESPDGPGDSIPFCLEP